MKTSSFFIEFLLETQQVLIYLILILCFCSFGISAFIRPQTGLNLQKSNQKYLNPRHFRSVMTPNGLFLQRSCYSKEMYFSLSKFLRF